MKKLLLILLCLPMIFSCRDEKNKIENDLSKYPSGSYYLYFNSEDAVQGCRLEEVQKVSTKIILNK